MKFDSVNTLIAVLISVNGIAFFKMLFDGFQALKNGATAKEKDIMSTAIKQRDDAIEDQEKAYNARDRMATERDLWHNRAMRAEGALLKNGLSIPDDDRREI